MAGKQLTATRMAQLDKLGEEELFRLYIEQGSVPALCREIFTAHNGNRPGATAFYEWMRKSPDRWTRWQKVKEMRAEVEMDLAHEEAQAATPENVQVQRLKVDTHKWRTGILNRDYRPGNSTNVQVNVGVGDAWLDALRKLETIQAEVVG